MRASIKWPALFLLLAILVSLFRFGERENENFPLSDSDAYLDMAMTFAQEKESFDSYLVQEKIWHYNRPGFPFAAAVVHHFFPTISYRSAFSLINVLSAWGMSVLLFFIVRQKNLLETFWLPSCLLLVSFPQLNWGFHILTDTSGLFLAFVCGYLVTEIVFDRQYAGAGSFVLLYVLAVAGFFLRETTMIALVMSVVYTVYAFFSGDRRWRRAGICTLVILAARIPIMVYAHYFGFHGPHITLYPDHANPLYWLDFLLKSGVAFHLGWLAALVGFSKNRDGVLIPFMLAWCAGALLYMAAGFLHNSLQLGYPTRMTFSLFPIVLVFATRGLEWLTRPKWRNAAMVAFFVAYSGISIAGFLFDPGEPGVTVDRYIPL